MQQTRASEIGFIVTSIFGREPRKFPVLRIASVVAILSCQVSTIQMIRAAAFLYMILTLVIIAFQVALALGMPWGEYAMGGAFPGQLPIEFRVAALVQASFLFFLAVQVTSRAGVAFPGWLARSRKLVWIAVFISAIALVLNLITPSESERMIWAPVAFLLLLTSLIVARRTDV